MLVLGRKIGERILIEGGITISVEKIKSDKSVRIGIEAPNGVRILREEVAQRIVNGMEVANHG